MKVVAAVWVTLGLLSAVGCGSPKPTSMQAGNKPLRELGILYGRYFARHGRAPADQKAFKDFISSEGVEYVAERWNSPRSGEPLVVLFGKQVGPLGPSGLPWIAYEKTEVDGKRLVICARGSVEEMATEQFQETFSAEALSKEK